MSKVDSTRANNNLVKMCDYWISMVQVATPSVFLFDKKYGMILPIRFVMWPLIPLYRYFYSRIDLRAELLV